MNSPEPEARSLLTRKIVGSADRPSVQLICGYSVCWPRSGVTVERQTLGKSGEDLAVAELERRGYAILARRYRTRHGEIDIVARDGGTLVFVEVKVKATTECGTAAEAVTRHKQRRVASMAAEYLARNGLSEVACRFDVVAIDAEVLMLIRDAFSV